MPEQAAEPLGVTPLTTIDGESTRKVSLSAKTLGALAVVGMVVAFSLSSTLVKRRESPGVLVAFWRLVIVSVVWNVFLWTTGRRVTMRDVRQVAGARRLLRPEPGRVLRRGDAQQRGQRRADRVARAVLHRAGRRLAVPRVHRPAGARVRGRRVRRRGARAVQRAARTATRRSRATCSASSRCCSWSAYVASTRYFRREMDVATFMATICPIAAVAVLPLAIAHGDVFGLSGTRVDVHADPRRSPAGWPPRG